MGGNQIIVYQPNETVRLDVRLENETVWLTQEQIANLFGTKRPAITKHLANIYKSGELEREGTCSILEHMGNDGNQSYRTTFYNLEHVGTGPVSRGDRPRENGASADGEQLVPAGRGAFREFRPLHLP